MTIDQNRTFPLSRSPWTTTAVLIALLAPAPAFSANSSATRGLGAQAPASAASQPINPAPLPEMGTTQVPQAAQTQLPDTPETPRAHYQRPPAHLP